MCIFLMLSIVNQSTKLSITECAIVMDSVILMSLQFLITPELLQTNGTFVRNYSMCIFLMLSINMESERELVTRFRTGSHSLAVETGRYSNIIRENRLCSCGNSVQTVWHVIAECCETRDIVRNRYNNLKEVFDDANIHSVLLAVTRKLKIRIR